MAILSNINDLFRVDSAGAVYFATSAGANLQVLQSVGTGGSPIWVDVDDIIGGPYLPLTGGTLTGNLALTDATNNPSLVISTGSLTVGGATTLNAALTGTSATFSSDVFSDGLYVNSTTAVPGTQVAIVGTGTENLQRWGSANSGQASYRFRIDQDYKFISNSGSGDNLTIYSDTGNIEGTTATFSGLVSGITPTAAANFATKAYVDAQPQGDLTSITLGNGLTGSSLSGPIPNVLMSGSYAGKFTIDSTGDVEYLALNTTSTTTKRVRLQFTQNDNAGIEIGTDYSVNNSSNMYIYDRVASSLMAYFDTGKSYFPGVLGIGTDSPTRGLTIAKSNEYASLEIIKSNSGNQIVYLGTGSSGAGENPILQMKEGTVEKIRLYATGDSWIDGGNLGVGTSGVDSKFKVEASSGGTVYAGFRVGYNGGSANYYDANSHEIRSGSSGTTYLTINSNGASFNKSIIIGTGGTYAAGAIYSDSNWGMILRAKQASPVQADFMFANSADVERLRITSTAATFAGEVNVVRGINMTAGTSTLYATDGALSYYSASNGVYLNGAGASGWLRLNASGVHNNANSINIYGSNFMNFQTANLTRLLIDASGNATFYEDVIVKGGYDVDGGLNLGTWPANSAYNFIGTNNMSGSEYCMITNGLSTYIGAASGGDTTIRCNANDSSHQLAITPNGAVFSGNTGLQNTAPQFYLHSNNVVTIPNNRYLNFVGTGATEIPQAAFKQALVCSFNTSTATSQPKNIGIILHNDSTQDNNFTPMLAFGAQSNSTNYSQVVAGIAGKRLGQAGDSNWSAGELWFWTGRSDTIGGASQGLPAANPAMVMTSTRQIGIATTSPASGVKLDVQAQALIGSLGFNQNRINSGYATAANNSDIWINYEGYLNGNSYYRDFRVGNGRNAQIMHWDGDTSRVAIGENASGTTARFQVLNNGSNGASGDVDYGILAKSSNAGQATIGAINTGNGHANLNLGSNDSGLKFWHISKRLSGDAHRLEFYYNAGTFTSLYIFETNGTFTAAGDIVAYSDKRLKSNIKTLDGSKVLKMRGVSFDKDGKKGSGVIAQELEKVAPELVHNELEYKGVAYGNLVGYLIEAIKELEARVKELENK